ncbi:MAG: hypothetical protein L0Y61_09095 [Epsilonproteobacteria bacterium]|nr:hypothetical protein [Campylobacterota bacterium]
MGLAADMKLLHAKKFREGDIKQATFLKSFRKDIFELVNLGYMPSEIKDYLEEKLDVNIKMNSFYAWLNYIKHDESSSQSDKTKTKEVTGFVKESVSSKIDTVRPESTLDILSSTDFD